MLEDFSNQTNSSENRRSILLLEDETLLAEEIEAELESLGYDLEITNDTAAAFEILRAEKISLLVADRMLNGHDSLKMIERLRGEGIQIPVLFVSALASVDERILGLKAGGDDYITKPFDFGELAARVEALLRRSVGERPTLLRVGSLEMNLIERRVKRGDREISLLPREFKLLEYLMRRPNQVVTRAMLLEDVWNYRFLPQTNLVDVHIGKLRHKLDAPGETRLIESVRTLGFILHAAE
jgi:two-component system OmpR family response regulator